MDLLEPPILLVCSVETEAAPIRERLIDAAPVEIPSKHCAKGNLDGKQAVLLVGGMGKTNAGHSIGALLARHSVRSIVGFGVAGAYRSSGLKAGELAVAASEVYGDEGVRTPAGWISSREIGIPLAECGERTLYNEFRTDPELLAWAERRLDAAGHRVKVGPFVTVSCCSGTADAGDALAERFGAICETMEGAAYAHAAALEGIPYLEIRGISNLVEDRDLSAWRISEAAEAAAAAVRALVSADL